VLVASWWLIQSVCVCHVKSRDIFAQTCLFSICDLTKDYNVSICETGQPRPKAYAYLFVRIFPLPEDSSIQHNIAICFWLLSGSGSFPQIRPSMSARCASVLQVGRISYHACLFRCFPGHHTILCGYFLQSGRFVASWEHCPIVIAQNGWYR
jgi:hypothetical protein